MSDAVMTLFARWQETSTAKPCPLRPSAPSLMMAEAVERSTALSTNVATTSPTATATDDAERVKPDEADHHIRVLLETLLAEYNATPVEERRNDNDLPQWSRRKGLVKGARPPTAGAFNTNAYLVFCNRLRSILRGYVPSLTSNGTLSRMLSQMWRAAPDNIKQECRTAAFRLRTESRRHAIDRSTTGMQPTPVSKRVAIATTQRSFDGFRDRAGPASDLGINIDTAVETLRRPADGELVECSWRLLQDCRDASVAAFSSESALFPPESLEDGDGNGMRALAVKVPPPVPHPDREPAVLRMSVPAAAPTSIALAATTHWRQPRPVHSADAAALMLPFYESRPHVYYAAPRFSSAIRVWPLVHVTMPPAALMHYHYCSPSTEDARRRTERGQSLPACHG
eukprot:Opistho-1_new@23500